MGYRRFAANYIFDGYSFHHDKVLVADEAGRILNIIPLAEAGADLEYHDGTLCPGFVNCHCHLELSALKGKIPQGTGLVQFLISVMQLRDSIQNGTGSAMIEAEKQMLGNGIVAVGDILNTASTIGIKLNSSLYYHNFIEVAGFSPAIADDRISQGHQLLQQFESGGNKDHRQSLVPHAPYSVSDALLHRIMEKAESDIISMHNQESDAENDLFCYGRGEMFQLFKALGINASEFRASGISSLQSIARSLSNCRKLLLVHNVFTSVEDIRSINSPDTYWCLCPGANRYIQERMPPLAMLVAENVKLVIGTDSLASNDVLDILRELKLLQAHDRSVSTATLLKAATSNGAEALEIGHRFGAFSRGLSPGILRLENVSPQSLAEALVHRIM